MGTPTFSVAGAARAREQLAEAAAAGLTAPAFLERVNEIVGRVIPTDGAFFAATDPTSSLIVAGGMSHRLPETMCQPIWDYEYQVPDYLKFSELVTSRSFAATLGTATGGTMGRSARHRDVIAPLGLHWELRAVFVSRGSCWGLAGLYREAGAPDFSADEVSFMLDASPIVAEGLQAALLTTPADQMPGPNGPGMLVFDGEGRLVSATSEAEHWLSELPTMGTTMTDLGIGLPLEAFAVVSVARAQTIGLDDTPVARARLRTSGGLWLTMHASCLRDADGRAAQTALVIEPAKASEVAPLVTEAYGFSPRELEISQLIARGQSTAEIAATLFLSPHTVRDHVKAIFEKVGVSSRGELVHKLFAEHYYTNASPGFVHA